MTTAIPPLAISTSANRNFDLIVFDWDGTLMDSTATITQCIQDAARDLGLPVPSKEAASHVIGLGLADALQHAVPTLAREDYPKLAERYRHHWFANRHQDVLFDGVPAMLKELKARHFWVTVATGKSRRGLDQAMHDTGLTKLFDWTRCADETHPKPHPAMLEETMRRFAIEPARALMVGDTTHDSQRAKNAGTAALSVTQGAHDRAALELLDPLAIVGSIAEMREWLAAYA